jgi:rRNA maturation protein Nop10
MSGLTKCPTCGAEVSTEASACPKCGHQFKAPGSFSMKDPVHKWGCILIVGLVLLMAYLSCRG